MVHTSKLAFAALLIALGSHAARADPAAALAFHRSGHFLSR